ncbi:MAG: hypothetical protein ACYC2H_06245 [Thermoplasmatota archaeon]
MRGALIALLALGLLAPGVLGATAEHREATFPMANGFDDRMTVVSGAMDLHAPAVRESAAFFRSSGAEILGLTKACWQAVADVPAQCADGVLKVVVPKGTSFGFNSPHGYAVDVHADHALATFVDLGDAAGFDPSLQVGPSVIASLVGSRISFGTVPDLTEAEPGGLTLLEDTGSLEIRSAAGILVHKLRGGDPPMTVQGTPRLAAPFETSVAVVPFADGASATFRPAREADAREGLSDARLALLDQVLGNVNILGADAKKAPLAIVARAGEILSEVFNGAFMRTSLADNPRGLGDVAFAKFDELTVSDGVGRALDFEGSYTLVVGDLGPSMNGSKVSGDSDSLRWWVGIFLLVAVGVVAAWLWLRDGPVPRVEPGPSVWVARIATAVGVLITFLVWDWQLNEVLGSSLLTTRAGGAALGLIVLVELASLALAGLLIGVPVFLSVRYGLALAKQPRYVSLAGTAAVFFTVAFGVLLLPALVSFLVGLAG